MKTKTTLKKTTQILGLVSLFISTPLSAINQIAELVGSSRNTIRCAHIPIGPEKCASIQAKALKDKCITKEEYDYAVASNYLPSCAEGMLIGVCTCGCFAPETRIGVINPNDKSEWIRIDILAQQPNNYQLWTLGKASSLSHPKLKARELQRVTHGPESKALFYISVASGSRLGLTEEHAVLLSDGTMVDASELSVGQHLVNLRGQKDEIVDIERVKTAGDVFNVLSSGKSDLSHLILAEGLIVGDLAWQNSLRKEKASIEIRQ